MSTKTKSGQQKGGEALASNFHQAERRRASWGQTPATRLVGSNEAVAFIERVGLATLFPASPEIPNLFHAYLGCPEARPDSGHSSPSGLVYGWRWTLGRAGVAFYGAVVRDRPTWVTWNLLPAILRLCGEARPPEMLHALGYLSADALRLAKTLAAAGGTLSTGELRRAAGFPTGKERRAAYLKAVAELDSRLLLAKVFAEDEPDMSHALVAARYPAQVAAAAQLSREEALDHLLRAYLPAAAYVAPAPFARHLKLDEPELATALSRLATAGALAAATLPDRLGRGYIWQPAAGGRIG